MSREGASCGGCRILFPMLCQGPRLFPVSAKGRGSGPPFGPVSDFFFFPILFFALLPPHPQPANEFTASVFSRLVLAHLYHCPNLNVPSL